MQNALVTGGAGFIGASFVRYLLKIEPGVRVVHFAAKTQVDCSILGPGQFVETNSSGKL